MSVWGCPSTTAIGSSPPTLTASMPIITSMKTAFPKRCRWWLIPAWAAENVRLLIVLAYTVVKLPFSLRMIKAAFYSIDTELEDAARNMGATFASSYGTSYDMVIQSMCAEEGLYGYNVNASGRRCVSTVFIMIVSGIILYLVYGVGGRDLGERLEAKARRNRMTGVFRRSGDSAVEEPGEQL